ncbi:sushi, von Willebrand factor type A, EGF and pentraxin domain-containing protein 1-like [Anopheles aquasalis]|uniref:sushi, von Willebrand factor type A, EGF and pentraxin domain-containing protein 1-like n=1 Tax=Anopheles aquasalis TaxID=42839 RepID=UPI00215A504A|nr:sushi, von Willebrand factor type A, EGF and pentraxin domain-containing protein 1-like [Anopheles aquasalis]
MKQRCVVVVVMLLVVSAFGLTLMVSATGDLDSALDVTIATTLPEQAEQEQEEEEEKGDEWGNATDGTPADVALPPSSSTPRPTSGDGGGGGGGDNTGRLALVSARFRQHIDELRRAGDRLDIVFLVDASSSVGSANFASELRFVKKLLAADFDVRLNRTRVALVTFSSRRKVVRHVDQISRPDPANDKCGLLQDALPAVSYSGGGTYTYGALREAEAILAGNPDPDAGIDATPTRTVFLVTDGYSNGRNPVPVAARLKAAGVHIFALAIETGNGDELTALVSAEPYLYLLRSYDQFEELVRQALHLDYRPGPSHPVTNRSLCDRLCNQMPSLPDAAGCCDQRASCSCGTTSGHYQCTCEPGYGGTGLRGDCQPCANGTYWEDGGDGGGRCRPCPHSRQVTLRLGATAVSECVCPHGYQANEDGRCVAVTCAELVAPPNGYFVMEPKPCGRVLNAACGVRCRPGYELSGSSIRLCQENGLWSGIEAKCTLKMCPPLIIPYYGMAVCSNPDLDLYYDYTPRNKTFMRNYSSAVERYTERMPIDTECSFKCGPGYYLKGSHNRNCLPLSKWDGLHTTCKQIVCPALPAVPYGTYEPTDCATSKSAFGTNCTLVCDFGFEMKGGPSTKQCGGRRTGVWSKSKTPRCVDIAPPFLECPGPYEVLLEDDYPYSVVRRLQPPYVYDNSGDNFTYWVRPALRDGGTQLPLGEHEFTYVAVDAFKNKARCSFRVTVIDRTPPVLEGCGASVWPHAPVYYVSRPDNPQETLVRWDEPTVFDNSGTAGVTMTQNVTHGYLGVGLHTVLYRAVDASGNEANCTVRVEVRQYSCETVPEPPNGLAVCAHNGTHVWCELSCREDFAFAHDQTADTVLLVCDRARPSWNGLPTDPEPECSAIVRPLGVEKVLTLQLEQPLLGPTLCDDPDALADLSEGFVSAGLRDQLCGEQTNCTLLTRLPVCELPEAGGDEATRYHVVKRRSAAQPADELMRQRSTVKLVVYKRLSQELGLWRSDGKKSDNIKRIKEELRKVSGNEKLRRRLGALDLDLSVLRLDELVRCANGSISRKLQCVHCPRGTYHNHTLGNSCQSCPIGTYNERTGQTSCQACPVHHSTSRPNAKHAHDCKPQCPPGTVARLKPMAARRRSPGGGPPPTKYQKTLMPFCRKCEPGYYQAQYNRAQCQACPVGYGSARGSTAPTDCFPLAGPLERRGCEGECSNHGHCQDERDTDGVGCVCDEGYVGERCELSLNPCASAPCLNGGTCVAVADGTDFHCHCRPPYIGGSHCELYVDPCHETGAPTMGNESATWQQQPCARSGGICVEVDGTAVCECRPGYEGTRCERHRDHCTPNPCLHGGVCVNAADGYSCVCRAGKTGRRCHLEPCDYLPCAGRARCLNGQQENRGRGGEGGEAVDEPEQVRFREAVAQRQQQQQQLLLTEQSDDGDDDELPAAPTTSHQHAVGTRDYRCVCPAGWRGPNCTEVDNPCDGYAMCLHGGTCVALKLRHVSDDNNPDDDNDDDDQERKEEMTEEAEEEAYRMVRCACQPDYTGDQCEQRVATDFLVDLSEPGTTREFVKLRLRSGSGSDGGWRAIGLCGWFETNDSFNYGTLVSYATRSSDNTLTLTDYSGLVLYVNGQHAVTNVTLVDGEWHFVCVSWSGRHGRWQLYLDGEVRAAGGALATGTTVPTGGLLVLGQEQDVVGGAFSATEAYRGRIAYVDVWSRELTAAEVASYYRTCATTTYHGDIVRWTDLRTRGTTSGRVRYAASGFCRQCPRNLSLSHGSVTYDGSGQQASFRCGEGYELIGPPVAHCLRTSRWNTREQRYCKVVRCGALAAPLNGRVSFSKTSYGGVAQFGCDVGFLLDGPVTLRCTATGTWSGPVPACVSVIRCPALVSTATPAPVRPIIIYATERGVLGVPADSYDEGVMAEVRCPEGYELPPDAENLLTCGDGGQWDLPLPECKPTTTTPTTTTTTTTTVVTPVSVDTSQPDGRFWKNLRDYLQYGCEHVETDGRARSLFCFLPVPGPTDPGWPDLSGLPVLSASAPVLEAKLLALLVRANANGGEMQVAPTPPVRPVYLLNYLLYGVAGPVDRALRYPESLEHGYRAVICRYIDAIVQDEREQTSPGKQEKEKEEEEGSVTSVKLKVLLMKAFRPIYDQYRRWTHPLVQPTPPAQSVGRRCPLQHLPRPPIDSRVVGVESRHPSSGSGSGIGSTPDAGWQFEQLRASGVAVEPGTRIRYGCERGFTMRGRGTSECGRDGRWTALEGFCEGALCEDPPARPLMRIAPGSLDTHYYVDDELEYRCEPGHILQGHPIVRCQPNGRWTPIMARCGRISCGRPALLPTARIIGGNSFQFGDSLRVRCDAARTIDITCQASGQWTPFGEC